MRVVVCDTGPVLHLREAEILAVLGNVGEVVVPSAVDRELSTLVSGWAAERPAWLRVAPVPAAAADDVELWRQVGGLGVGEAEAIVLARTLPADWLLTDDAAARVIASLLGLEVHGSLGVLLWAAAQGHLDAETSRLALERLAKSSLWISARILSEARQALHRLFE